MRRRRPIECGDANQGLPRLMIVLAMVFGMTAASSGESSGLGEYDVKAAFLFHFAQFVEWPADILPNATAPLTYCTIGDDPFRGALDQAVKGKSIAAHPLQVQHLKDRAQIAGCQILFIGAAEKKHLSEYLTSASGHAVLTVGDSDHFAQAGGVIGFLLEDNKVRFEINVQHAGEAKLKISSRLLLLAKNVIGSAT